MKTRKKHFSFLDFFPQIGQFLVRYFRTVWWVFLSGILAIFFLVVFTTPFFSLKVDRIELILQPEPVFDRNALMALMNDFSGRNIFRLSTTEIFTTLQSNIRHIQSVEKTLLLPDGIRVRVTSFWPLYRAYIWDEIFLLTKNGQLIVDIPEIETPSLRIHNLVSDPSGMQNTTLSTVDTFILQDMEKMWYKELPDFPIEGLDYYDQEKELHITSKGTRFIFSLSGWIQQIRTIALLIRQEKIFPQRFLYIDVRVPNKLYICSRDDSNCTLNLRQIYNL